MKREKTFKLNVKLKTKEEIHTVSLDEYINGYSNHSMSHSTEKSGNGEVFDFIFSSEDYDKKDIEKSDYYLKFYVSEHFDNEDSEDSDDIHKGETPVKNNIKIAVKYGRTYNVVISGDKKSGYEAKLE